MFNLEYYCIRNDATPKTKIIKSMGIQHALAFSSLIPIIFTLNNILYNT